MISNNLLVSCLKSVSDSKSQDFSINISTSDQHCGSTLKLSRSDVENETKFDVGFSTLHKVDTASHSDVEVTLHNIEKTSKRRCRTLIQRCINVVLT